MFENIYMETLKSRDYDKRLKCQHFLMDKNALQTGKLECVKKCNI